MHVKIDTKERFREITVLASNLTANMAVEFTNVLSEILQSPVKNIVLNLNQVESMDAELADTLVNLQNNFYDSNNSFVICGLSANLEQQLDEAGQLEHLNFTPTLSEAWDLVQMEEIERELLDGFD